MIIIVPQLQYVLYVGIEHYTLPPFEGLALENHQVAWKTTRMTL